jgi:hypothetical protein
MVLPLCHRWRPLVHMFDRNPLNHPDATPQGGSWRLSGAVARIASICLLGATASLPVGAAGVPMSAGATETAAPQFDATTADSFARSYQAIVAALPAGEVPSLELAIERTLRYYALTTGGNLSQADLINLFGGKTAGQVVASAPLPDDPTLSWASP